MKYMPIIVFLVLFGCSNNQVSVEKLSDYIEIKQSLAHKISENYSKDDTIQVVAINPFMIKHAPGAVLGIKNGRPITTNCLFPPNELHADKVAAPPGISSRQNINFRGHFLLQQLSNAGIDYSKNTLVSIAYADMSEDYATIVEIERKLEEKPCREDIAGRVVLFVVGTINTRENIQSISELEIGSTLIISENGLDLKYDSNGSFIMKDIQPTKHFLIVTKIEPQKRNGRFPAAVGDHPLIRTKPSLEELAILKSEDGVATE